MALRCAAYPDLFSAASAYLEQVAPPVAPDRAAIAIACPITGDYVEMTNHAWSFSTAELTEKLGMDRLDVVNDFTAQALAIRHLTAEDRVQIGPGERGDGCRGRRARPRNRPRCLRPHSRRRCLDADHRRGRARHHVRRQRPRGRCDAAAAVALQPCLRGAGFVRHGPHQSLRDPGRHRRRRRSAARPAGGQRGGAGQCRSARGGSCRDVLRHARHRRRESGVDPGLHRRRLHCRRHRAQARRDVPEFRNSGNASRPRAASATIWHRSRPIS